MWRQFRSFFGANPGEKLRRQHVAVFRGVLPGERAARIRAYAEEKLGMLAGENYSAIFSDVHGDERNIDPRVILHLLASPMLEALRRYFGAEELVAPLGWLVVRRFDPRDPTHHDVTIPWHQDAPGLVAGVPAVNCWTLLSPESCGDATPGIEFIPGRWKRVMEIEREPCSKHYAFLEADHAAIESAVAKNGTWSPTLRLGDVLVLDGMIPHRTGLQSGKDKPRISAELRFAPLTEMMRCYLSAHPQPCFTVSGRSLVGPTVIRRDDKGRISTVQTGAWAVA